MPHKSEDIKSLNICRHNIYHFFAARIVKGSFDRLLLYQNLTCKVTSCLSKTASLHVKTLCT